MDLQREADRWWRQALADLSFLPVARQAAKCDTSCFLAQQTAEKAIKVYLFQRYSRWKWLIIRGSHSDSPERGLRSSLRQAQ